MEPGGNLGVAKMVAFALGLASTGCGGKPQDSPAANEVTSTVPSVAAGSLTLGFAQKGVNAPVVFPNQITLVMSNLGNAGNACQSLDLTGNVASLETLVVILGSGTDPRDVVTPGTYTKGDRLGAVIVSADATCAMRDDGASAATVKVDEVTSTSITGSFDLTFPDGHLSGSFDAPFCEREAGADMGPPDGGPACHVYPSCGANAGAMVCIR
jgi:hypothetical protein